MRAQIPTIPPEFLDQSISGRIGVEYKISLSAVALLFAGAIAFSAPATAAWKGSNAYAPPADLTTGRDMQLQVAAPVLATGDVVVTMTAEFEIASGSLKTIEGITPGAQVTIESTAHGMADNDQIEISGLNTDGSVNLNGRWKVLDAPDADTITIDVNVAVAPTLGATPKIAKIVTGSAVGTIKVPERVSNQTKMFPKGLSVDIYGTSTNAAKKIRRITGITSVAGGAAGMKLQVLTVPEDDTFSLVSCTNDKTWGLPTPGSVNVPCGYQASRWVKPGRGEPPQVEVKQNYSGMGDGLSRYNGFSTTVKIETWVADTLLTERLYFGGWVPTVTYAGGDGNAVSEATGTGNYEEFMAFV